MKTRCDRCGHLTARLSQHQSGARCYAASILAELWSSGFVPYFYDTPFRALSKRARLVIVVDRARVRCIGAKPGYFVRDYLDSGPIADRIKRDSRQIEQSLSRGKSWYQITREV